RGGRGDRLAGADLLPVQRREGDAAEGDPGRGYDRHPGLPAPLGRGGAPRGRRASRFGGPRPPPPARRSYDRLDDASVEPRRVPAGEPPGLPPRPEAPRHDPPPLVAGDGRPIDPPEPRRERHGPVRLARSPQKPQVIQAALLG